MLNRIKIFIASSIEELKTDRIEIGDFFRQLNEIYIERGIHFSLIKCEDYDDSISLEGKQNQYDAEIRDSEISFFLFFKKVGDYTKHEFEVALESYKNTTRPKIVTYFKYVDSADEVSCEVSEFMNMLSGELNHYYNTYGNIDTLKLGMLMQIKLLNLDNAPIKVDDGKITVFGENIADCKNIPMFSENPRLATLKAELETVNAEYFKLRGEVVNNENCYEQFVSAANKKKRIEEEIKEIEDKTLSAAEHMHSANNEGKLTERQKAAYRLLEKGDIEGSLNLLNKEEILSDIEKGADISKYGNDLMASSVNELMQRIYLLYISRENKNKYQEIEELYKVVCEKTMEFNLNKDVIYNFAAFLNMQKKYSDALMWIEKAELYARLEDKKGFHLARIYSLMGLLYKICGRIDEAEITNKKALEILQKEEQTNDVICEIVTTLINLANVYNEKMDYEKAIETTKSALPLAKQLAEDNTYDSVSRYCCACQNIGVYLLKRMNLSEAIDYYKKALNIIKPMYEVNPEGVTREFASIMTNMSKLSKINKELEDAKYFAETAMEYYEKLVKINSARYEEELAFIRVHYADLIEDNNKAMKYLTNGIEVLKKYYGRNPAAYAKKLGGAHLTMGMKYFKMGEKNIDNAVSEISKTVKIYKKQIDNGALEYELSLAAAYNILAVGLAMGPRVKASVQYFKFGIDICKKYAEKNVMFKNLLNELTTSYDKVKNHLSGNSGQKQNNNQKKNQTNSNNKQKPSSQPAIAEEIKKSQSELNRGENFLKNGNLDGAEKAFKNAMSLCGMIKKEDAAPLVSLCCYRLAVICEHRKEHKKALDWGREMAMHIDNSLNFIKKVSAGDMYKGYGNLLARADRAQEATDIYMKAINCYEAAQKETAKDYHSEIGEVYDYLTVLAANAGAVNDAIMVGTLALTNHTMCKDRVKSKDRHANSSLNLAHLYAKKGNKENVEKLYLGAIDDYKWLTLNQGDRYAGNMTEAFNMLINFYKQNPVGFKKVESAYLEMIEVFEKLCEKSFEKHAENLASLYESVSNVVVGILNLKKSKEYKTKAKEIRNKIRK